MGRKGQRQDKALKGELKMPGHPGLPSFMPCHLNALCSFCFVSILVYFLATSFHHKSLFINTSCLLLSIFYHLGTTSSRISSSGAKACEKETMVRTAGEINKPASCV